MIFTKIDIIGGGRDGTMYKSVNELEELFGFKISYYKDADYPDDDYKTDFSWSVRITDGNKSVDVTGWNYKSGHYAGIELTKDEKIEWSISYRYVNDNQSNLLDKFIE